MQIAAAEAAARAEAQELEGWKRDSTAVLAALDSTHAEKITEVTPHELYVSLVDNVCCTRIVVCICLYAGCVAHMRPVCTMKTALWHPQNLVKQKGWLRTDLASDANQHQTLSACFASSGLACLWTCCSCFRAYLVLFAGTASTPNLLSHARAPEFYAYYFWTVGRHASICSARHHSRLCDLMHPTD